MWVILRFLCKIRTDQASELSKSLLLFSKGDRVNKTNIQALNYLKIYGANCFGNKLDKLSNNDRIKWVDNNIEDIVNFDNFKLINKADNKYLFIAFCFEFKNYLDSLENNLDYYITHFPIQLDATCNGYQHVAFLTQDIDLATHTNLTESSINDTPNDFYGYIAQRLKINLSDKITNMSNQIAEWSASDNNGSLEPTEDIAKIQSNLETYIKLLNFNIPRSLVKTPIMVSGYNASIPTMMLYIKEYFRDTEFTVFDRTDNKYIGSLEPINTSYKKVLAYKEDKEIMFTDREIALFIKNIMEVIYQDFPKIKGFNKYLKEIARLHCQLNKRLR